MDTTINRAMTPQDSQFIDVNLNRSKRNRTSREIFQLELSKQEQKAAKLALPFARNAAREDFEEDVSKQTAAQMKKYGSIEDPIKVPNIDWKQYSDLKNFKVIEESERTDDNLSGKNPGLNVQCKVTKYQYKDYASHRYIVMESGPDAIKRAVINRARLDKQVSAQIETEETKK